MLEASIVCDRLIITKWVFPFFTSSDGFALMKTRYRVGDVVEFKEADAIPRRLGAQGNMAYLASGPLDSNKNLPVNLAITSNSRPALSKSGECLKGDRAGGGRGPQPGRIAGA